MRARPCPFRVSGRAIRARRQQARAHAGLIAQVARTLYEGYSQPITRGTQEIVRRR